MVNPTVFKYLATLLSFFINWKGYTMLTKDGRQIPENKIIPQLSAFYNLVVHNPLKSVAVPT